ncbi:PepSY domain-containing protein [Herminiimonas sp. KBW02]|uniref:PepSY-associated TM helix domain-containing protein n=1 Tax=Herminiimonas sp. KBW02 TaxID=2153363 RepID=UPI001F38AEF6|nr:PepSY-associated TM helix domain-containing protein [Herminiimonas sp. KBW02]
MKDSLRLSMSWLHTWCGLLCGWLLCAIFLAGSLSVFRDPITHWMKAEPVLAANTHAAHGLDAHVLASTMQYMATNAAGAPFWRITLPEQPGDALQVFWRSKDGPRTGSQLVVHPESGAFLSLPWGRQTEGGRHFMSFHYALHADMLGFWLVGFVSMGMLLALVSGVIVHKRIFKDFFTFRPGKGQRSWLDAHNVTAVLALPFLFMIVYTGLAFFYTSYMPMPLRTAYGSDGKAYAQYQQELAPAPILKRKLSGEAAPLPELSPLMQQAQNMTGLPARMLLIERPGDASMTIKIYDRGPDTAGTGRILNSPGIVTFDGVTGAVLQWQKSEGNHDAISSKAHRVVETLHVAGFGGWGMKWLYFLCGIMGMIMIATGTILFSVKRRNKNEMEFGFATARVYRWIEALNVASVTGICVACISYLYANRLIDADFALRSAWEIRAFFIAWLLTLLHAMLRPAARAWVEQLAFAACLCIALPLLNFVTTGAYFVHYLQRADWQGFSVEMVALTFGVALAYAAYKVWRKNMRPAVVSKAKR